VLSGQDRPECSTDPAELAGSATSLFLESMNAIQDLPEPLPHGFAGFPLSRNPEEPPAAENDLPLGI
jgi:hypothetical protein